jgi:hypothetical protein
MSVMSRVVVLFGFGCASCLAQTGNLDPTRDTANVKLEKMAESLEVCFALNAIPPHLHEGANRLHLHPSTGYVANHRGTNGFNCIVMRAQS